jgi:hypothetical protein
MKKVEALKTFVIPSVPAFVKGKVYTMSDGEAQVLLSRGLVKEYKVSEPKKAKKKDK